MESMKVKCIKNKLGIMPNRNGTFVTASLETESISIIVGKVYESLSEEDGFYQIVDESGETYWHPVNVFQKI